MDLIRVWTEIDIEEIDKHLVIVDDIHGFCPGCKQTGIKYNEISKCPKCDRNFKYVTTRENPKSTSGQKILAKIRKNIPNLTIIDYSDYKSVTDKNKAKSLFSN